MTIETEATPRPWVADDEAYIRTPEGVLIAVVHDGLRNIDTNDPIARANAALIVRAVNSLDALVEALKAVTECTPIDSEWGYCGYCQRKRGHEDDCPIMIARHALSLASGARPSTHPGVRDVSADSFYHADYWNALLCVVVPDRR